MGPHGDARDYKVTFNKIHVTLALCPRARVKLARDCDHVCTKWRHLFDSYHAVVLSFPYR